MLNVLLAGLDFSLPLKSPVLIFSLLLFIILFAPIILNRLRVPHLIGLIIAGAVIGPHGLNLMLRDSSIVLFGTVGLLYIMFLAGLEIDLNEFKKNSWRSLTFGLFTFLIPMGLGTLSGLYLLGMSLPAAVLLASMFASHTLIAYPLLSRLGVVKNRAVQVAVGGTMITDTLALLVLAVIVGMSSGEIDQQFWITLGISLLVFVLAVMVGFPLLGRWFFKRFDDSIAQYIFVLGLVFLGAFMAEAAGVEGIIGAFLAGLALNRLIPHTSALMNRIEFVGNALFIPFFLIGVGMLINYRAFFKDLETIKVAIVMTVVATLAKYAAAWLTQKTFGYSADERRVIFGLSSAQAAATLAAVLVGYNIVLGQTPNGEPIRLLSEPILNGTILMILVTCTTASFSAQKGGQNLALIDQADEGQSLEPANEERILIPVSNLETTPELINLGIMVRSRAVKGRIYALSVIDSTAESGLVESAARKVLDLASTTAAATDTPCETLLRYDLNVVNGIAGVVMEHRITDIIIGLHHKAGITDTFLGNLTEGLLSRCSATTLLYRSAQPLATLKRYVIVVPAHAERELGFAFWVFKVWNLTRAANANLEFHCAPSTAEILRAVQRKHPIEATFHHFVDWDDFLILSRHVHRDDALMVVLSRKNFPSYHSAMTRVPAHIDKYFNQNSVVLAYPWQSVETGTSTINNPSVLNPLTDSADLLQETLSTIGSLFKRK